MEFTRFLFVKGVRMVVIFIIGTAGSGKSLLTSAFSDWLRMKRQHVISVNLDPGVRHLPYAPDVDVREHISLDELMERYMLGPNGGLVLASDLIAIGTNLLLAKPVKAERATTQSSPHADGARHGNDP